MTLAERHARRLLIGAALGSALGVAVAGTASPLLGGVVVVLAWATFVYGLHAFGRAGAAALATSRGPAGAEDSPRE